VQPKILNLNNDIEVKTEFLRLKCSFIAADPPLLKDKLTTVKFYDWKFLIIQYLEFLPGYQAGMLEIQPNLENMTEADLKFTTEKYELVYTTLSKATISNKLVEIEDWRHKSITSMGPRSMVVHSNNHFSTFRRTNKNIAKFDACEQEENQTGTEFLQSVEEKSSELRKLGLIYSNFEIGNKVYEGLLPNTKLSIITSGIMLNRTSQCQ